MLAQGDATSHAQGIGFIWGRFSEQCDAEVGSYRGFFAFVAHIAPTWLECKPLQGCKLPDHVLCLANLESTHKWGVMCARGDTPSHAKGIGLICDRIS